MIRRLSAGFALVALLASAVSAQTVDELIAKNIEAKGGMEKIKSVQSMRMTGKMTMGPGVESPFIVISRRPMSNRVEFTFQGLTGVRAFDGKNAWTVMPFTGKKDPEELPAEVKKLVEEQADFDGPLVDYKTKGHKVELVGKEAVEGADAYKLKLTLKSGDVRYIFLDAESHLEIASEGKMKMRGAETDFVSSLGDYKDVGGMMIPHSIANGVKGSPQRQTMTVEKIELNVTAPDSLFAMPPGTRPAAVDTTKAPSSGSPKDPALDKANKPAEPVKSVEKKKP